MSDQKNQVAQDTKTSREKIVYYLMTASGVSIGFAVAQMNALAPDQFNPLFYIAILLWIASFLSGFKAVRVVQDTLSMNAKMLEIQVDTPLHVREQIGYAKMVEKAFSKKDKRFVLWSNLQMLALIIGVCCYILWQVLKCKDCLLSQSILNLFN